MEVNQTPAKAIHEPAQVQGRPTRKKMLSRKSFERIKSLAPMIALLAHSLVISVGNTRLFDFFNSVRIANSAAIPLVRALGATFVILLRSVDLSVEGVLALGAVVVAIFVHNDMNQNSFGWIAPLFSIAAGAALGFLNGGVHVKARIPSFIGTLWSWFVGIGLATLILGGSNARGLDSGVRSLGFT